MPRTSGQSSDETKQKIKDTFLKLSREKSIDRITVAQLTSLAQINRSTFYYYYEDVYALQDAVEQDFLNVIEEMFPHIIAGVLSMNFEGHLKIIQDFYLKYQNQYRFFLVEHSNPKLRARIQNYATNYALHLVGLTQETLTIQQRLMVEYIANAQLGLISYWLENGQELSVEELSRLITRINMQGPMPTLLDTRRE